MHTPSEQNVYIGEQVSSFADQMSTRRCNHHADRTLHYSELASNSLTLNRMLNRGLTLPVSGTWCPDFRQPDYVLLQPTPKRRRTSSGSAGFPRRYCTSSRNGHFSNGLSVHSSSNLPNMCEMTNHRFVRSLDARNPESFRQNNVFANQHSLQQHWPQVLPTSQHPNRWQNELQQVTSLVSVAAAAAAAAAAATQTSTPYHQQSFIPPATNVSFSEIPCSSSQNYVAITSRARGFTQARPGLTKRPNYRLSFSNGVGSTKRRSEFTEVNETNSHTDVNGRHSRQELVVNNKGRDPQSPSSFSSALTSAAHCNHQLNSSVSLQNPLISHNENNNILSNNSENTNNCDAIECTEVEESTESLGADEIHADCMHRTVGEQSDLLTSDSELSSQSTNRSDVLSFAYASGCNTAAVESNSNNASNSFLESVDSQQQRPTYTLESNITSQGDQSSSTVINKNPINVCFDGLNSNGSGALRPHHYGGVNESVQFTQSCFSRSEMNGSTASFVVPSPTSHPEEATVVAAAVVASAAAHAVAAAAQAVSAAVHHRRASDRSGLQTFPSQSNSSVLMHAIPNQRIIDPLVQCTSQSLECNNNCPVNHLISDICNHGDHNNLVGQHGFNYRQSQFMSEPSTNNVLNSFSIHPTSMCNLSSSQAIFDPSTFYSSPSTGGGGNTGNFACNSDINLHIPNICTGLGQLASSSMLHSIIPAFTTSDGLTLIPSTSELVDTSSSSYPFTTISHVTSATDNTIRFTMPTSGLSVSAQNSASNFISTPLAFSDHIQSNMLNNNTFSAPGSASHYQSSIYSNLPTEVAAAAAATATTVSLDTNNSPVNNNHQFTDLNNPMNFLPSIVSLSSATTASHNASISLYLPPSFSSVTPIPVLPLRPQLSTIGPSTLATTRGVNTLLQFLRLIHQRPDSYALPYYPSAMTATAGGSNQSVVVSASAGVANGTRVASAVTPPLVPHHPIVPPQTSLLAGYAESRRSVQTNLLLDNLQTTMPSPVSVQPITSAAAALAVAMAAAVALQQQSHRHASSNAISMLTPSRAAPTPSIPVPILHAHLYYPRNVATVQQLQHNAHQQCYHSHYGGGGGGVQHQHSISQRPASMPNSSANGFVPSNSSIGPVFAATSSSGTTTPAYLTSLFPFLLAVPTPSTSNNNNNSSATTGFAVNNFSESLFTHYTDHSVRFSNGSSILSQSVSDPTSAATAAAAAAAVAAAAAAAASVDTLIHLAVQLESTTNGVGGGRGLSKEELESLPIRLYISKTNFANNKDFNAQKSYCDDDDNAASTATHITTTTSTNEENDDSPSDEYDRCMICLDDYEESQQIRQMRCSHEFHADCVDKWLKTKRTCPLCRADAFTGSQRKDDYL
ncbi:unnamed protein product [Trichobilharzia szidati]|nr:unnamed protein product [Trichobilharzia szidati]